MKRSALLFLLVLWPEPLRPWIDWTLYGHEKERGPDFLRLANALSALYPKGSEEKRLLGAMLPAVPR